MALAGHLEDDTGDADQPRAPRRVLRLESTGALPSGEIAPVLIHNVSTTGLLFEASIALDIDTVIAVDLPEAGAVGARIVWRSANLFGCRFEQPISDAVLSAAQLRGVTGDGVGRGPEEQLRVPGQSLQTSLRDLRRERGLTLGQLATRLGVSKPTVWAWEQGKSRPVPERIDAIAEALGVDVETFVPERGGQELPRLLARCREEIGRAVGTDPARIRISIDL
ncbi:hypothetical protein B2G71_09550 [Novosphingobium sp. PC22D]|uniref:helix-turn-helix domain-containing protein n=1 Tax=Novosphingobium sp. PC22D TaxID=1962403 RepID=UPI000BF004C0|nr:helix-turn-helix transcriptional regulator [Novosphingobium sp. PC22D]PEQ13056.1 hypothetical protein B2G71_09550 [Novosphingobium sp. PC22D]